MSSLSLSVLLCLVLLEQCLAIPPYPLKRRVEVKGPDGSVMPVFLAGDALSARFETEDGYTVVEDPDSKGHWIYLRTERDFTWKGSVHPPPQKHLVPKGAKDRMKRVRMARKLAGAEDQPWALPDSQESSPASEGQRSVLVVAINFRDSKLALGQDAYRHMVFGETASLKAFYARSSYGKLDLVPARETCGGESDDGIAVVDLPQTQPVTDTTEDDGLGNNFTTETLKRLGDCVDFAAYDKNADGVITPDELSVVFVLPGREAAIACSTDKCHKTWAKYRYFGPLNQLSVANKRITGATYIAELGDCECTQQNYYGVLCHEFAHSLGLPSLEVESEGDDSTLMKTGGWCTPEPCDFDPWSKAYLGWTRPRSIPSGSENVDAELTERGTSPETDVIRVPSDDDPEEMFLIEKRPGELGPSVWRVRRSSEAPVVHLSARDALRWSCGSKDLQKRSCANFEVRGSSQLGRTLLLRFNDPKTPCQANEVTAEEEEEEEKQQLPLSSGNTGCSLNVEAGSVVNITGMLDLLDSHLSSRKGRKKAPSHKAIPEPSLLLPIIKELETMYQRLKAVEETDNVVKSVGVYATQDSSNSNSNGCNGCNGCNGESNCCNNNNNCCCCCCCCCGCKSCDKCSKYENKADFYWKCDETKCIPYNDEDDAPVPEDCFDDNSSQHASSSSKYFSSSSSSSRSSSSSSSSSSYPTDPQDLSEDDVSSEESDISSSSHESEEEAVMTCSGFTYELLQGRNCLSSSEKSSIFEESTHVRQSSSRSSSSSSGGGGGGGRNGMRKNSVAATELHAGWLSALLF